uniref:Uncharacterized protein n=1 Tax=Avena sativa TaxID=4498 RepID=A0ACD5W705_AVESA
MESLTLLGFFIPGESKSFAAPRIFRSCVQPAHRLVLGDDKTTLLCSFGGIEELVTAEELKQSLLTATVELEASKEELRRKDQTIGKLADLVRQVAKERDEALDRAQHLALLAKQQAPPPAALVTSSVTDSDCSLVSSPVDPFFDPVTSSDRSRCGGGGKLSPPPPAKQQKQCGADAVLDMLAGKRPLPPRGRFLQSVMEAGPLLQNLLVAGPLPRWRNPPPMHALPVGGGVYLSATPLHTANALGYAPDAEACVKSISSRSQGHLHRHDLTGSLV